MENHSYRILLEMGSKDGLRHLQLSPLAALHEFVLSYTLL